MPAAKMTQHHDEVAVVDREFEDAFEHLCFLSFGLTTVGVLH